MAERVRVRPGDIYQVEYAPGMAWFVEAVFGVAHVRCVASISNNATSWNWSVGRKSTVGTLFQTVIARDVPDFEAAVAFVALRRNSLPLRRA